MFDYIFSEHLIEHLSYNDGALLLSEAFRVLKSGGRIRIATPNLNALISLIESENMPVQKQYIQWFTSNYIPDSRVRCMFPDMAPLAGYAVTAKIHADKPDGRGRSYLSREEWWDYIETIAGPRVIVIEDLDEPKGLGAFWGEVQANIHTALGCAGCITDGAVRDLPPVRKTGFQFFSGCVSVSHAYANLVEIGTPVTVGGLSVHPGDLLFGDMHGVVQIPLEIARDVRQAAEDIMKWEEPILDFCKSEAFSKEKLKELVNRRK